ncbi:biotin-dependent carboxyltransferase family protein [Deinococcus misasensis]|uniref:5-oxoprolinase subunit C family protein n=1 Tax=Deinococcus misasensis TaxID=392413 RepID=UPI00068EE6F4|nr:biotin-dependent carboxyltransferase family protein [Deinococcus misasensis]
MNRMHLNILKPGLLTLVQDLGRQGFRQHGVSQSGALDLQGHRLANFLLGNVPQAATLEITLGGLQLEAASEGWVGLAGSGLHAVLNGQRVQGQRALHLKTGDCLEFKPTPSGARAYLALPGGLDVPEVLGSRSTHLRSGVGPPRIQAGMVIKALGPNPIMKGRFFLSAEPLPALLKVQVIRGPEWEDHPAVHEVFQVTAQSDRMGLRLEGPPIRLQRTAEMYSVAVLPGTVQLPSGGQPIVLLSDAQTTGGYPRILQVIQADLWKLGQVLPGQHIQFQEVSIQEATRALREQHQNNLRLQKLLSRYIEPSWT